MSFAIFLVVILAYTAFLLFTLERTIITGKSYYAVLFAFCLLPLYQNIVTFTYANTNVWLARYVQLSKELVFFLAIAVFLFYKRNIFTLKFRFTSLDYVMMAFAGLSFLYMLAPLGDATLGNKIVYFKNILLFVFMYFLGRNCDFGYGRIRTLLHSVLIFTAFAFLFNCYERVTDTHLHSNLGFAKYHDEINETDPTGSYGLTWTFEAQDGNKRFGSIYSNPLDLSAASLIAFAISFILFYQSKNKNELILYGGAMLLATLNLGAAYSRASFAALFSLIFFIALIFRVYKLIGLGFGLALLFVLYIIYFAPLETQYFVIDTITFQNPSSLGHALEWFQAIESMAQSPQGIGLATSGNAGGVESELQVGGENQFLIYGVQLGVLGFLLYTSSIVLAILLSLKAYRVAWDNESRAIPFIASAVKFSLLLPLFTSNMEIYLFVSLSSWWMVGYSMRILQEGKSKLMMGT